MSFRTFAGLLTSLCLLIIASPTFADHHEASEKAAKKAETAAARAGKAANTSKGAKGAKAQRSPLLRPMDAKEKAPEKFKVRFETTQGDVVLEVTRSWSPNGADRVYNLVKLGYFQDIAFFRVIPGFMSQFGMHGDPKVMRVWNRATIMDDPVVESNLRGMVSFAKTNSPHSRSTQFFINLADNPHLDQSGFSPFAKVIEGMDVVDKIYPIGEGAPRGAGPNQSRIKSRGNAYLREQFPKLDYLKSATLIE